MSFSYFGGTILPFIAPITLGTIQLGATIDYAILVTTSYINKRKEGLSKEQAMLEVMNYAVPSILISGMCFFAATFGVGLYSDIVKQREKAKIQVKEDMPVLTVIEPVVEPTVPSKPQRALIVLASLLLGLFVGCGFVLIQPIFSQIVSSKKQAHTIPIKRMKKIS